MEIQSVLKSIVFYCNVFNENIHRLKRINILTEIIVTAFIIYVKYIKLSTTDLTYLIYSHYYDTQLFFVKCIYHFMTLNSGTCFLSSVSRQLRQRLSKLNKYILREKKHRFTVCCLYTCIINNLTF